MLRTAPGVGGLPVVLTRSAASIDTTVADLSKEEDRKDSRYDLGSGNGHKRSTKTCDSRKYIYRRDGQKYPSEKVQQKGVSTSGEGLIGSGENDLKTSQGHSQSYVGRCGYGDFQSLVGTERREYRMGKSPKRYSGGEAYYGSPYDGQVHSAKYPTFFSCSGVVAYDGHHSLYQAEQRHGGKGDYSVKNTHGGDGRISSDRQ